MVHIKEEAMQRLPRIRVTGMPGKHVAGSMETVNKIVAAVRLLYTSVS